MCKTNKDNKVCESMCMSEGAMPHECDPPPSSKQSHSPRAELHSSAGIIWNHGIKCDSGSIEFSVGAADLFFFLISISSLFVLHMHPLCASRNHETCALRRTGAGAVSFIFLDAVTRVLIRHLCNLMTFTSLAP